MFTLKKRRGKAVRHFYVVYNIVLSGYDLDHALE